jgi:ATP-dependent phosphofructokinase / diphosphate-dependent phosphofructokinase
MRIGMLTGGGDCPGLNAVIRAVVGKGIERYNHTVFGFQAGDQGLLDQQAVPLTPSRSWQFPRRSAEMAEVFVS